MESHVDWTAPAALWDQFRGPTTALQRRVFRTPAILRFTTDQYMPELLAMMQSDPHRIGERLAVPETWSRRGEPAPAAQPKRGLLGKLERARNAAVRKLEAQQLTIAGESWSPSGAQPLKLFHPASERYYLVTACLICRNLGLPDRPVNTSAQERVSFVLRMLQTPDGVVNPDPAAHSEFAFVGGTWVPVTRADALQTGEEEHLMSPLTYVEDDGRKRRMYNGVIPVARRESLVGAPMPQPATDPPPPLIDPRQMMLKLQVIGPWANLEDVAARAEGEAEKIAGVDQDDNADKSSTPASVGAANDQIQAISWFILLDLAAWLREHLDPVWQGVQQGRDTIEEQVDLVAFDALDLTSPDGDSLLDVLRVIDGFASKLETTKTQYPNGTGWPPAFQFVKAARSGVSGLTGTPRRDQFETALKNAMRGSAPADMPVPALARVASSNHVSPWFTVRCVYERPNCGPIAQAIVSEPTASFQLASFFDPDAPARPIRVEMPADTTPAGLRKFDKNTAFVMSDVLCGQLGALRGLTFGKLIRSVLPWPLHQDLNVGDIRPCTGSGSPAPAGGMVCSLSIPIITICALILLMIIVKLLDAFFYWLPFFQICLPIPKFDAKRG